MEAAVVTFNVSSGEMEAASPEETEAIVERQEIRNEMLIVDNIGLL
jgi:hypothetical protein